MTSKNPRKIVSAISGNVTWRARFTYMDDRDGRRKFRSKTCKTRKEADAWLVAQRSAHLSATYIEPSSQLLDDYARQWFARKRHDVLPGTWSRYYRDWVNHVRARLGHRPIGAIRPHEVQGLYDELSASGMSPRTVQGIHRLVGQVLASAVADQLITSDPSAGRRLPRPSGEPVAYWSLVETECFLEYTRDHFTGPLWRLLVTSGLRLGEALALTWDDIDASRRIVLVTKTVRASGDRGYHIGKGGKTSQSNRVVVVPASTLMELYRHREQVADLKQRAGQQWTERDLIFPRASDGDFRRHTTLDRIFKRLCKLAGVPVITPHGLRHTYATLAIRQGVNFKVLQRQLGHSSARLTLDLYSHVSHDMQETAADALEDLFRVASR